MTPPLTLARPDRARLEAELARVHRAGLTYAEVGATRGELPEGYRRQRRAVRLGRGDGVLARAAEGVLGWRMHTGAGLLVAATSPVAAVGVEVALAVPLGPVWRLAPCRVTWTLDEPDRRGFGYGTLPGHPEAGEESFVVERDASGEVVFRLAVFSRLAWWDSRLIPPASRAVQVLFTRRYERAVRRLAAG